MDDAPTHIEDYSKPVFPKPGVEAMRDIESALRADTEPTDRLLEARSEVHGDFSVDAAASQSIKDAMRGGKNWPKLTPVQVEALEQIATKIGRILSGDPNHPDHWADIQGYARLAQERL